MPTVLVNGVPTTFPDYPLNPQVEEGNQSGGGGTVAAPEIDREYLIADYRVKTAFSGNAVADWIRSVELYDVSGTGSSQIGTTSWRNLTQATTLNAPPAIANLEPQAVSGLTSAQLVAAVSGLGLETTQAAMSAKIDAFSGTKVTAIAALPAGGIGNIGWLSNIWDAIRLMSLKLPLSLGPKTAATSFSVAPATDALFPANTLAALGVAKQLPALAATANTALVTTTRRISIYARDADIRYVIGSAAQTAAATSHFIAMGERMDLAVPATPNIAVMRAGTINGVLEVTELV